MWIQNRLPFGEIADQSWCPRVIRNYLTDFLQFSINQTGQYIPVVPRLFYFMQRGGDQHIVDLCSGGSGPWLRIYGIFSRAIGESFRIVLTDRSPNLDAFGYAHKVSKGKIVFREEPFDICGLPIGLIGFRTLFGSFHHFTPVQAKQILQDAVDSGQGIGIFEMTDRSVLSVLGMISAPLFVLLHTPKIKPYRWSRYFFTYILPVVPLVVMLDGVMSCLRSYSIEELVAMTGSITGENYDWEIRKLRSPFSPFPIIYVLGSPNFGSGENQSKGNPQEWTMNDLAASSEVVH